MGRRSLQPEEPRWKQGEHAQENKERRSLQHLAVRNVGGELLAPELGEELVKERNDLVFFLAQLGSFLRRRTHHAHARKA